MTEKFKWISTGGGPMILIAANTLSVWEGDRNDPERAGELTDYGRAGEVFLNGYQGVISCGPHQAVVIGDEPSETTWLPFGFSGGMIAQWTYAPSIEAAEQSLLRLKDPDVLRSVPWQFGKAAVNVACNRMLLFDAALDAERLRAEHYIEIPITPGPVEFGFALYEPTKEISFVLHSIGNALAPV